MILITIGMKNSEKRGGKEGGKGRKTTEKEKKNRRDIKVRSGKLEFTIQRNYEYKEEFDKKKEKKRKVTNVKHDLPTPPSPKMTIRYSGILFHFAQRALPTQKKKTNRIKN
jgi:hypothetical protein